MDSQLCICWRGWVREETGQRHPTLKIIQNLTPLALCACNSYNQVKTTRTSQNKQDLMNKAMARAELNLTACVVFLCYPQQKGHQGEMAKFMLHGECEHTCCEW